MTASVQIIAQQVLLEPGQHSFDQDCSEHHVKFLIYPTNKRKEDWNLVMTFILILTCLFTPINIAFSYSQTGDLMHIINYAIDIFYLVDIIVIFNTAIYDQQENLVQSRKAIAVSYLTGWFTVDLLSIIPFSWAFKQSRYNNLARVARAGRLYKLVKLTKLIRILKVMKDQNKILKIINDQAKVNHQ